MDIPATSLNRVIACNGSVAMEPTAVSIASPTEDAREGTAAHTVASAVLSGLIADPIEYVDRATPNGIFVTAEMAEHVAKFTDHIQSRGYEGTAQIHVETPFDFGVPNTQIFIRMRPDFVAYDPVANTLYIDDFKYGFRTVEPEDNWVLIAYALGVCFRFNWQPVRIEFRIHQPRPYHRDGPVRLWPTNYETLMQRWSILYGVLCNLDNGLHSGPHCRKCKALATCAAAREAGLNAVEASNVVFSDQIPNDALAFEIENLRRAEKMIEMRLAAIEELAVHRIENGQAVGDLTVEQNYGHRTWNGGTTYETLLAATGHDLRVGKLKTPAAAIRENKIDENVVAGLSYRPPTSKKLVHFNATKRANKLFNT